MAASQFINHVHYSFAQRLLTPILLNKSPRPEVVHHRRYHHKHMTDVNMVEPFVESDLKDEEEGADGTDKNCL